MISGEAFLNLVISFVVVVVVVVVLDGSWNWVALQGKIPATGFPGRLLYCVLVFDISDVHPMRSPVVSTDGLISGYLNTIDSRSLIRVTSLPRVRYTHSRKKEKRRPSENSKKSLSTHICTNAAIVAGGGGELPNQVGLPPTGGLSSDTRSSSRGKEGRKEGRKEYVCPRRMSMPAIARLACEHINSQLTYTLPPIEKSPPSPRPTVGGTNVTERNGFRPGIIELHRQFSKRRRSMDRAFPRFFSPCPFLRSRERSQRDRVQSTR